MTDDRVTGRDGQPERPFAGGVAPGTGSQTGQSSFGDLREKAVKDFDEISAAAKASANEALDRSTAYAEQKKGIVAEQLAGIGAALEKVGREMKDGEQAMIGRYARDLGSSAQRLAADLQGKDMADIVSMAEGFGRRQPVAFLGIAAIAGLAASRFVTASARRHEAGAPQPRGDGAETSANPMAGRLKPEDTASSTGQTTPQATRSTTGQAGSGHEDRMGSPAFRGADPAGLAAPSGGPVRPAAGTGATGIGGSTLGTSPDRPSSSRETPTLSPSGPNPHPAGRVSIGGSGPASSSGPSQGTGQTYNSTSISEGSSHVQQR